MVSRADNVITNTEAGAKPAMAASPQRQRDYLLDNYKALLITLVVMGHFIEPCYQNNDFLYTLKWLIVSFHMPAFIFISGYFSRRELKVSVNLQKLLVAYIVYVFITFSISLSSTKKQGCTFSIPSSPCGICLPCSYGAP